jgi:hypothetical protein
MHLTTGCPLLRRKSPPSARLNLGARRHMKQSWPLLFALLGCTPTAIPDAAYVASEKHSSYVHAVASGPRSFTVSVRAPDSHPLFLENCNGAVNWALTAHTEPNDSFAWITERDACLSAPIKIEPGTSGSLQLVTSNGASAPPPGQYHVVLLGVFASWSTERPIDQPQVSREHLISNPIVVGQ